MRFDEYLRFKFEQYEENIAVKYKEKSYTYCQLNYISDQIAYNIKKRGIQPKSRIGILMDRNEYAIFTIIGIIKAGCVYAPLSKDNPSTRLNLMIKVAEIMYVITDCEISIECNMIIPIHELLLKVEENSTNWENDTTILYTMFTSGTTGFPKSFDISSNAVLNLVENLHKIYFNGDSKVFNILGELAELVFDMSQGQIYLALLNGITLDIIPTEIKKNPRELYKYLQTRKIAQCDITPTLLRIYQSYLATSEDISTNATYPLLWTTSGEKLTLDLAKSIIGSSSTRIANSYGPAEACVYVCIFIIDKENINQYTNVPIGKPINNVELQIVDEDRNPVDAGKEGQIVISGCSLTSGYIGLNDLNNKVFYKDEKGKVFYCTGDIGVFSPETKLLYFLGRNDNQIKYHGIRLELEEIDSIVKKMDGIKDSISIVKQTEHGADLITYYTTDCAVDDTLVRNHLQKYLPISLLPKYCMKIDSIPVSINGKLQVSDLPTYEQDGMQKKTSPIGITRTEIFLQIIREILGRVDISLSDDIYQLGMDSISFISILVRAEIELNRSISYKGMTSCRTLNDMYVYFENCPILKTEQIVSSTSEAKLNSFQLDILKSENINAAYPTHNVVQLITVSEYLNPNVLQQAVEQTVYENDGLRCSVEYRNSDGYYLILNDTVDGCFQHQCVDSISKETIHLFIKPIKYEDSVRIKIILFEDRQGKQLILLNAHHIVFDYLSVNIFLKRVLKTYYGISEAPIKSYLSNMCELPDKYVVNQRKKFWQHYYLNRKKPVTLPYQSTNDTGFDNKSLIIDGDCFIQLKKLAAKKSMTLFQVIIAIFSKVIYDITSENDIIIGAFFPGRTKKNGNLIGLFTTCLGLRIKLDNDADAEQFLESVRQSYGKIMEYQDTNLREVFGYMKLNDLIKGELFSIIINYHSNLSFSSVISDKNIQVTVNDIGVEPNSHPLNISVFEAQNSLKILASFDKAKFTKDFIKRLLNSFAEQINYFIQSINLDSDI